MYNVIEEGYRDIKKVFIDHHDAAAFSTGYSVKLSENRKLLLGAYFTMEYSVAAAAQNKGMSFFPEKINGLFAMVSRQDNENLFIMYSEDIYHWENPQLLKIPEESWEFIQIGNCGSPIKTDDGWLLLTHGVGAVRRYCIGALLLDYQDPTKIIAQLKEPLLWSDEKERNGYVPNVVYSCGGLIHNNKLIIPYAVSDTSSKIAIVDVDELICGMDTEIKY